MMGFWGFRLCGPCHALTVHHLKLIFLRSKLGKSISADESNTITFRTAIVQTKREVRNMFPDIWHSTTVRWRTCPRLKSLLPGDYRSSTTQPHIHVVEDMMQEHLRRQELPSIFDSCGDFFIAVLLLPVGCTIIS